ncbi:hypothetical protein CLERM_454 [Coxiella-like endosymbiont]|nr:hypothetical protein CLERM_454 [Coxiella-like endosymbiont]
MIVKNEFIVKKQVLNIAINGEPIIEGKIFKNFKLKIKKF